MRIAVNGKSFNAINKGGALRVADNIVDALARARPDWEIDIFVPAKAGAEDYESRFPRNVHIRYEPSALFRSTINRTLWEQFVLPRRARGSDILLNLANSAPVTVGVRPPQILLLHDVGFLNSEWFSPRFSRYLARVVRRAAAHGVHFTTPSQSSADEIKAAFPQIRTVTPIYNAAEDIIPPLNGPEQPGNFLLLLSSLNPRKNIRGAIDAFQLYRASNDRSMRLLVVGGEKPMFADHALDGTDLTNVEFTGAVTDALKWQLLRQARALMLPSFLEGFGLPILEALSVGTPVVASDLACFRELYLDAVEYVDPASPSSIADGIARTLVQNGAHVDRRTQVAARFSWETSAEQYAKLIERIVSGRIGSN